MQAPPSERGMNELLKIREEPIELETIKMFDGMFEKEVKTYAHEKCWNRITVGA